MLAELYFFLRLRRLSVRVLEEALDAVSWFPTFIFCMNIFEFTGSARVIDAKGEC